MSNAQADEPEPIGFFIDEDLPHRIAEMLRSRGITATSVLDERREGLADEEQLRFAAAHNLVLVTANVADYVELARQWAAAGRDHPGLVFIMPQRFPRRNAAAIAQALNSLAQKGTPLQMRNSARFLSRG